MRSPNSADCSLISVSIIIIEDAISPPKIVWFGSKNSAFVRDFHTLYVFIKFFCKWLWSFGEVDADSVHEIIRKSLACILASSTADKSGLVAFDPIMAAGFDFEMQRDRSAGCHPFLLQSRYAFPTDWYGQGNSIRLQSLLQG